MALETATYVSDLVLTNPTAGDPIAQGANHLRLLKTVLQATFPAVTGAVTSTHTDLNGVGAVAGRVTTLEANRLRSDQSGTLTGSLTLTGTLNAPSLQQGGAALVPAGVICMWAGATSAVPSGWQLCDGTGGTPDLRNLFIVGAGNTYSAYQTGGASSASFTTSTIGAHSHGGATSSDGSHSHGGATAGHTLTVDEIPSHTHPVTDPGHNHTIQTNTDGGGAPVGEITGMSGATGSVGHTDYASTGLTVGSVGNGNSHLHGIFADGVHGHSIAADGSHNHTGSVPTLPPFVALGFIMKL